MTAPSISLTSIFSMEATNTNILVFDLIRSGLDPYSTAQT
jgi:hypothetical protein